MLPIRPTLAIANGAAALLVILTAALLVPTALARQQQVISFLGLPTLENAAFDGGDVNGDSRPDLFLTGTRPDGEPFTGLYIFVERRVTPRPNTGPKIEAVYEQQAFVSRPVMQGTVNWVDLNGDGLEDVLTTGTSIVEITTDQTELRPFTDVYLSRNGGLEIERENGLPGVFDSHVEARDFDGDGATDILLAGNTGDGHTVGLYWNTGSGRTFVEASLDFGAIIVEDMAVADVTGNGFPDIVLTGRTGGSSAPVSKLFRNEGNGTFTERPSPLENLYFAAIAAHDLTSDGAAELISTGARPGPALFSGSFTVLENDGSGSFTDGAALLRDFGVPRPAVFRGSSAFGDINGDGNIDLVIQGLTGLLADDQNEIAVYAGTGGAALVRIADMSGILKGSIRLIDYDGNGSEDVIIMGQRTGGQKISQILEF